MHKINSWQLTLKALTSLGAHTLGTHPASRKPPWERAVPVGRVTGRGALPSDRLHPLSPAAVRQRPLRQRDDVPQVELREPVPSFTLTGAHVFLIRTEKKPVS